MRGLFFDLCIICIEAFLTIISHGVFQWIDLFCTVIWIVFFIADLEAFITTRKTKVIDIKYFVDDLTEIEQKDGSDWIDLRSAEDMELKKGNHYYIPLGVAMKLPKGYEAHVAPRSSTFKNFKIIEANHVGVIDETYCGNDDQWFMSVIAMEDSVVHKNDRVCQFRIMKKQDKILFNRVAELDAPNRGGCGSTGIQ